MKDAKDSEEVCPNHPWSRRKKVSILKEEILVKAIFKEKKERGGINSRKKAAMTKGTELWGNRRYIEGLGLGRGAEISVSAEN